ncbi:MAG: D-glycerate dehydrogenase [Bacillota bacterium]
MYVTRRIPEAGMDLLREFDVRVWPGDGPPPREVLFQEVRDVDGLLCLLTDRIDRELFDRAERLRVVSNYAAGYDNIDVADATRRGILVTNTPGVLTDSTADLTFALLLALARRIPEAEAFMRSGRWKTWSPDLLTGIEVTGSVLGIVGMGRIGEAVARRARGFSMKILYTSRTRKPDAEAAYQIEYVTLPQLLSASDFVTIHVPLTQETTRLIGKAELSLMKKDACIINTSRGAVLDQRALCEALSERRIRGAALDVFEEEPVPMDDPIFTTPGLIIVPHIGSATTKTRERMAKIAASNLRNFLLGLPVPNPVNPVVLNT